MHIFIKIVLSQVVNELDGNFPTTREDLVEKMPGIGKYSGSAIASIAFKENVRLGMDIGPIL